MAVDQWYEDNLVCPVDRTSLKVSSNGKQIKCNQGHVFPIIDDIPYLLPTSLPCTKSQLIADEFASTGNFNSGSTSVTLHPGELYVLKAIRWTNGYAVTCSIDQVPIPQLPLSPGNQELLLDVGCNWGRWTIAAAQKGYEAVGLDPSLEALKAAKYFASRLEVNCRFVAGDIRSAPFRSSLFDKVFSFGTFQSLNHNELVLAVREVGRLLKPWGQCKIHLRNSTGLKSIYNRIRRRWQKNNKFAESIYYYDVRTIRKLLEQFVGRASLEAFAFLTGVLSIQDVAFIPKRYRPVLYFSEMMCKIARLFPQLVVISDAFYVMAVKQVYGSS